MDLRQTPSYVTYMCLMSGDGVRHEVTGKAAVRALRCYLEWVGSMYPYPVARTEAERRANADHVGWVNAHRKRIDEICEKPKTLKVYMI
jgi:hypothetical protein